MWPHFTNIDAKIVAKIKAGNPYSQSMALKGYSAEAEYSKKNVWVRVISGADDGCVMQSNSDTALFNAVGDTTTSILSTYGYGDGSGAIGVDWNGNVIRAVDYHTGRPSPIVTSLTLKEGKDQISRHCEISFTCYTLEQMELIQKYYMEPGYTLLIEYGFNTPRGVRWLLPIDKELVKQAGRTNLDQDQLHYRRVNSYGEYDSFMGFVVGGNVSMDGDKFIVNVKLRGAPGLPTWMQSQHVIKKYDKANELEQSAQVNNNDIAEKFSLTDLNMTDTAVKGYIVQRRFKYMFNSLPEQRRTNGVKNSVYGKTQPPAITPWTGIDFINMDPVITRLLTQFKTSNTYGSTQPGELVNFMASFMGNGSNTQETKVKEGETAAIQTTSGFSIPKEKIFSNKEFIKFERAIDILNQNSGLVAFTIGGKPIYLTIDIQDCIIGAFKGIYSTDSDKLLILGEIPDFSVFFMKEEEIVLQYPPALVNVAPEGRISHTFAQPLALTVGPHREDAYKWGLLRNLYINFDLFKKTLETDGLNIRQILEKLLNEMSSAVNGFWNFQIVEKQSKETIDGKEINTTRYTVIDENWVGKGNSEPVVFQHLGADSRFLEANLSLDIPGAMTNQIVAKRLDYATNPNAPVLNVGGMFNAKRDKFLGKIDMTNATGAGTTQNTKAPRTTTETYTISTTNSDGKVVTETRTEEIKFANQELADRFKKNQDAINQLAKEKKEKLGPLEEDYAAKNSAALSAVKYQGKAETRVSDPELDAQAAAALAKLEAAKKELNFEEKEAAYTKEWKDIKAANQETKQSNISANFDKITILPDTMISEIADTDLADSFFKPELFNKNFKIYACKDTAFFDVMKQNEFGGGNTGTGRYSHPLPIKYDFTIYGTSGIRRGDTFNIDGIPRKYKEHGLFQVTQVEQTISDMKWTTKVLGEYRQKQ